MAQTTACSVWLRVLTSSPTGTAQVLHCGLEEAQFNELPLLLAKGVRLALTERPPSLIKLGAAWRETQEFFAPWKAIGGDHLAGHR